ncbi:MAG: DNA-3-methyladenine glycosylase I [Spirochaetaceae bacterium]|jgi:DNA-3-methyladenine glycosylase I|nr:DNA-3-methyladenine glycosylase I [Spirochaetaceae bacterium]
MKKRCIWASEGDPLYEEYHDSEWGTPVHDDIKLFEFLILEGAQAGLSWITILKKRENYRLAFDGFNPVKVAKYGEKKRAELMGNPGIVRNGRKIDSAIRNARVFLDIQKEFGSFDAYIWGFVGGKPVVHKFSAMGEVPPKTELSDIISKDLKKRGMNFVGSTILYAFMQAVGMVNDHTTDCFRYAELIRAELIRREVQE